ncbi:hypothetical protein IF1G_01404 [Cordyceps javanica]|uniref:Uncharacterized protein n=1 Tax=Cordyceps javanica TaxID=43265 RepID=A0A545VC62_9HYPO|nr:hypothetical protein IF1G_01404 [Cordyceps javanica]
MFFLGLWNHAWFKAVVMCERETATGRERGGRQRGHVFPRHTAAISISLSEPTWIDPVTTWA